MTDKRESDEPIRVQLKAHDGWFVPNRTYEKTIEVDRDDWNWRDAAGRRELVEEMQRDWLQETFDLSYEVLDGRDFDDPSEE